MQIVEQKVTSGDRDPFELDEFLSRPLFAHLATNSEQGPRESPIWFLWKDQALWAIGGTSFPANLERDPRCTVGIVDFVLATGLLQHVGLQGTAEVLPLEPRVVTLIFAKYMGNDQTALGSAVPTRGPRRGERPVDSHHSGHSCRTGAVVHPRPLKALIRESPCVSQSRKGHRSAIPARSRSA